MTDRDWSAEVTHRETLREVLGSPPPPLSDYDLTSVLIDERETSVTLRFFAFAVPVGARIYGRREDTTRSSSSWSASA
ncbi:hypothetical protein [Streptomyces diastatochromogenes]|uniref:Uncharacterized protein n=1 Tax=Streptomyces diastatochromogenes TaxID=42236 RepID=A0A233S280_STRDA|nr:hypothetical protein [Streptomyces diastatochromogenes]MCZ0991620.1 hypothetical protein [Streptomyces diastatochromogenes]OXY89689.1 hypothetical protein BEK98_37395 [Streptomyces diastatochromogenes]